MQIGLLRRVDDQPTNFLVEKIHTARLSLLYNHTLLQFVFNSPLVRAQNTYEPHQFFTEAIMQNWVVPKEVLRKEIILALRDCPNSVLFLAVMCKHENESLFVGVGIDSCFQLASSRIFQRVRERNEELVYSPAKQTSRNHGFFVHLFEYADSAAEEGISHHSAQSGHTAPRYILHPMQDDNPSK